MATYYIHESNMERLEKKLATISKKCEASHCSFKYEITGTEFKECSDSEGRQYTAKYFIVEVEGTAKYNGWEFVATLDHHAEGNVIRAYNTELTIPDKYKTCGPTCEHCNKIRSRKDTYLIYNAEKSEFKQVGKSCLAEFTNGLSAEDVTFFCSIYEKMESSESFSGSSYNRYIEVESILRYAFECYKHWGYQKSKQFDEEDYDPTYRSTKSRVTDYYYINRLPLAMQETLKSEMEEVGFNADSEYAVNTTAAALAWIKEDEGVGNDYIRNLHILCSEEYVDYRSLGIIISLPVAYDKHLGKIKAEAEKTQKKEAEKQNSEWVAEAGDKLTVNCKSFACISSWEGMYGMTWLYKFTDEDDNVYVWYASNPVEDAETVSVVKGTVKSLTEYNGVKQNVLTRCKVTARKEKAEEEHPEGHLPEIDEAITKMFDYFNS